MRERCSPVTVGRLYCSSTGSAYLPYFPREKLKRQEAKKPQPPPISAWTAPACGTRHRLRLGGMALTLARDYGATVTGITLSTEQLAEAQARAEAEGLADRVSFQLLDYRAAGRSFDRVVSVGMFEHVGVFHYRAFFDTVPAA